MPEKFRSWQFFFVAMSPDCWHTLPETNIAPENRASQKERLVFQPSIFRGELLVSGSVNINIIVITILVGLPTVARFFFLKGG